MPVIAVTGATGQFGRLAVESLKQRLPASSIVALARNVEKAAALGVAARPFDYNAPLAELTKSLEGVDVLIFVSSSEVGRRENQHANVIAAAKEAGIGRIAYTSHLHADTTTVPLAPEHIATEAALKSSGIPYTFLRNGWYFENNLASVGAVLQHGVLIGGAGAGKISFASRADLAEAAAIVATTEGHSGAVYELVGDTGYTLADLAAEIATQSGKAVAYKDLPEAAYSAALEGFGLPGPFAAIIAACDVEASKGALHLDDKSLSKLLGRPTSTLKDAVADALKAL